MLWRVRECLAQRDVKRRCWNTAGDAHQSWSQRDRLSFQVYQMEFAPEQPTLPACQAAIEALCSLLSWAERTIIIVIPSLPCTLRVENKSSIPQANSNPLLSPPRPAVALYTMQWWSYGLHRSFSNITDVCSSRISIYCIPMYNGI